MTNPQEDLRCIRNDHIRSGTLAMKYIFILAKNHVRGLTFLMYETDSEIRPYTMTASIDQISNQTVTLLLSMIFYRTDRGSIDHLQRI